MNLDHCQIIARVKCETAVRRPLRSSAAIDIIEAAAQAAKSFVAGIVRECYPCQSEDHRNVRSRRTESLGRRASNPRPPDRCRDRVTLFEQRPRPMLSPTTVRRARCLTIESRCIAKCTVLMNHVVTTRNILLHTRERPPRRDEARPRRATPNGFNASTTRFAKNSASGICLDQW